MTVIAMEAPVVYEPFAVVAPMLVIAAGEPILVREKEALDTTPVTEAETL
jgi:hypothetical protein